MRTPRFWQLAVAIFAGSILLECTQDALSGRGGGTPAAEALPANGWTYTELWRGPSLATSQSPVLDVGGYYEIAVLYDNSPAPCQMPTYHWRLNVGDPPVPSGGIIGVRFAPPAPLVYIQGKSNAGCASQILVMGIQPKS